MNDFSLPPNDFRIALVWAAVTVILAFIRKPSKNKTEDDKNA